MGCHFLLQGIFPTQGSNPGLPHCRQTLLVASISSNLNWCSHYNACMLSHVRLFVHVIFQARILECVVIFFSRDSSSPGDQICISHITSRFFTTEPLVKTIHTYTHTQINYKMLFSHKKEYSLAICSNMDRLWEHYVKGNKSRKGRYCIIYLIHGS